MKKFIINTLLFLTVPLILYVGTFTFLKFKFKQKLERYSIFLLGDSQTEYINIPLVYNRSIKGCPYFVHYAFAKEFVDELKGKKIYISANYHNLSKLYENRLKLYNDSFYPEWRNVMIGHIDDYNILNYSHKDLRSSGTKYKFIDIGKAIKIFKDISALSGPNNSSDVFVSDTNSIYDAVYRHWENPEYVLEDKVQREYLCKLIDLLKNNGCEVVLLKMPLTKCYINRVPLSIKRELVQFSDKYDVRILDLNETLSISDKYNLFTDYGHLNRAGDIIVRNYLLQYEMPKLAHLTQINE